MEKIQLCFSGVSSAPLPKNFVLQLWGSAAWSLH